jgi:hypothetical protein
MKNIIRTIVVLVGLASPALAQQHEQQVFSPYPQPQISAQQMATVSPQAGSGYYQGYGDNRYMVYPGRERYGDNYGYIPRHPGDYRDAVDRGQWEGGGGASMPRRSFSGY